MAPISRTSNNGSTRLKPSLEIIPDTRFVVFHGTEHEASSVKLTGVVRLTAPDSMTIQRPKISLEGKRKISWLYMGGIASGEISDKKSFWTQEQKLGVESAHKIKAGTIEWPFEFELAPSMPESVEGLRETYIAYYLQASVSRPGWNTKDVTAQEHIRIVRTLGQDSMEMTRSRVNADVWANKISYSISIATDAVVFGTSIVADVELSPIKKGLEIGKVELRLVETVVKRIQLSEVPDARSDRVKSEEAEVASHDMDLPEDSKVDYSDETVDSPMMADEMYRFKATLPLPKSLNTCRQDVDSHQINVSHKFKLMVNLHNPEGHISQLVCRLPVKIFISPNLPVNESNEVVAMTNGVTDESLNNTETTVNAPPQYGQHLLDQIFSDSTPGGYLSRAPSNPPSGEQSRRTSEENLASLNDMARDQANGEPLEDLRSPSPNTLHMRLMNLEGAEAARTANGFTGSLGNSPSAGPSPPAANGTLSRRASDNEPVTSIHQRDYDIDDLSRVPSYGAALRTPGHITPHTDVPPSYTDATSRPPSPLQRPGQAHTRSGANSPIRQDSSHNLAANVLRMNGPAQEASVARPQRSHRGSTAADDEARMRTLRART